MAAPTFVASYGPGTLATGTTRTASVTTAVGDLLVMAVQMANGGYNVNTPTGGTGLTWTLRVDTNTTSDANTTRLKVYTAVATTAETFTCSVGGGTTIEPWVWQIQRWSNHGGYGGSASTGNGGTAPSLAYTTTAANSALVLAVDDWNAIDGTTRTARTGAGTYTETLYLRNATSLTTYGGYHADAGTANAKTLGYTAPTGQKPAMAVVEVLAAIPPGSSGTVAQTGSGSLSITGSGVALAAKMKAWQDALANRTTSPVTALWVGDSISEGQGASARANRWQDILAGHLRSDLPTTGVTGGYGYIPSWYAVFTPDSTWSTAHRSTTGTISDLQQLPGDTNDKNPGLRHTNLAAGATLSFTVTGTSVDIWWQQGYGSFTYKIDAGSAVTVNTSGGTQGYPGRTTGISLGTAGSHTVLITATTAVRVAGLMVYNGDESKGLRFVDSAHVGWYSDSYFGAGMQQVWSLVSPDLVMIELGANDCIYGHFTSAGTKANIQQLITEIRNGVGKQVSIAVGIFDGAISSSSGEAWSAYRSAIASIGTDDPTVAVIDWGTISNVASDGAHPNNTGYAAIEANIRPALVFVSGTVNLTGTGTLATFGPGHGQTDLTGTGTLVVSANANGTVAQTGTGTLAADGTPIQFVASSKYEASANVTTVTVARPTGATTGDLLIAVLAGGSGTVPAVPTGWTAWDPAVTYGPNVSVHYRWADDVNDPASWDWTVASQKWAAGIAAFRGVDPVTPKDVASVTASSTTGWPTVPTITTATDNDLVLAIGGTIGPNGDTDLTWLTDSGGIAVDATATAAATTEPAVVLAYYPAGSHGGAHSAPLSPVETVSRGGVLVTALRAAPSVSAASGSVDFLGSGSFTLTIDTSGSATTSGTGALTVTAAVTGQVDLTGTGTLAPAGAVTGQVDLTGTGILGVASSTSSVVPLTGTGSLAVTGVVAGAVAFTGTGALVVSGNVAASLAFTGTGALVVIGGGVVDGSGSVSLAGTGAVAFALVLPPPSTRPVRVSLTSSPVLNATLREAAVSATLVNRVVSATVTTS